MDVTKDFQDGLDQIDVSSFGFSNVNDVLSLAHQVGDNVVIDFGGGDVLKLLHVQLSSLDGSDFVI